LQTDLQGGPVEHLELALKETQDSRNVLQMEVSQLRSSLNQANHAREKIQHDHLEQVKIIAGMTGEIADMKLALQKVCISSEVNVVNT